MTCGAGKTPGVVNLVSTARSKCIESFTGSSRNASGSFSRHGLRPPQDLAIDHVISDDRRVIFTERHRRGYRSAPPCHNHSYRTDHNAVTSTNAAGSRYHSDQHPKRPSMRPISYDHTVTVGEGIRARPTQWPHSRFRGCPAREPLRRAGDLGGRMRAVRVESGRHHCSPLRAVANPTNRHRQSPCLACLRRFEPWLKTARPRWTAFCGRGTAGRRHDAGPGLISLSIVISGRFGQYYGGSR
jgi:hypothetical protein